MKRAPIEPSEKMAKAIIKARKSGKLFKADGISIEPPAGNRKTWRIRTSFQGSQIDRSAKNEPGAINAAFLEVRSILKSKHIRNNTRKTQKHIADWEEPTRASSR